MLRDHFVTHRSERRQQRAKQVADTETDSTKVHACEFPGCGKVNKQ